MNQTQSVARPIPPGTTGIPGVLVGHGTYRQALTGCTVVLLPAAGPYNVFATGGAVSTRQVSALVPNHSLPVADALMVAGGSAFGLDSTGGALSWLEQHGRGIRVGSMQVPSVPSAAVFDLFVGDGTVRPDQDLGRLACEDAKDSGIAEGRVGAGTGATVGKALGLARAAWGGVGMAGVELAGGVVVTAVAVVNAFGNVHDPLTGAFVSGAVADDGAPADAGELVMAGLMATRLKALSNTTIGLVVTNGALDNAGCSRAATLSGQALANCIRPCQTMVDGDAVFVASAGDREVEPHQVGVAGSLALSRAIIRAVTEGVRDGPPSPGAMTEAEDE
ncbi:MAG: P1 family peptidase [Deltaproteobacteria bacterium]|nr:P1 family peptidase [Deltaproteobacteria bacterium]